MNVSVVGGVSTVRLGVRESKLLVAAAELCAGLVKHADSDYAGKAQESLDKLIAVYSVSVQKVIPGTEEALSGKVKG